MRNIYGILLALLTIACQTGKAQTYTAGGGSIPDAGPEVAFPITVSGLSPATLTSSFGLETVCINITHTYVGDLTIKLKSPDGTITDLALNIGGGGHDYTGTCFNQSAATNVGTVSAPFTGTFRPMGNLGDINNGQPGDGVWYLLVQDAGLADTGNLIDVSLTFGTSPAVPYRVDSTDLPLVIINTHGNIIVDDPKVLVQMGIIDNGPGMMNHVTDPFNNYNGWAGIEYRGSSSATFPQKSYGFETWDSSSNTIDASLLGMPSESDWILYAPYDDKTLMRNVMTYKLARDMGHYASRARYCELILDGKYQGVYVLMEKIKRDANRVDIKKLRTVDTAGDDLTGGYIIKIDKTTGSFSGGWTSAYLPDTGNGTQTIFFQYEYPKAADIQVQQMNYIKAYVDSLEKALDSVSYYDTVNGYRHFIDVPSFIDYFIMNEVSHNLDGLRLSTFMYKNKNSEGGKLVAGPEWDFNLAWWNANYCDGSADTGWAYNFGHVCTDDYFQVPFWWRRMLRDTTYANQLKCRWNELRSSTLSNTNLFHYIDSSGAFLDSAQVRHFTRWPILGVYTWPNPSPLATDYPGELTNMKNWIAARMLWLDANMPGTCHPDTTVSVHTVSGVNTGVHIYPNPSHGLLNVDVTVVTDDQLNVLVYSVDGRLVHSSDHKVNQGNNRLQTNLTGNLSPGMYLVKVRGNGIGITQHITLMAD
jgi:subtilisin-like proprotein convertase family protein